MGQSMNTKRSTVRGADARRGRGRGRRLTSAFVDSDYFAERNVAVGLDIVARFHTHFVGESHFVRDATREMISAHGST